ncbi:hypothetical protein [Kitasatospora purpeofusca]|uniref:hypothetical protein n=1 Tax=Kitasatospora purpeofusca TaxID=67352 RepID=UPI00068D3912|nr:hypothetical protein [Kitasatospora purpeofusca]
MNRRIQRSLHALTLAAATVVGAGSVGVSPAHALLPNRSCGTVTGADAAAAAQLNQVLSGTLAHAMTSYRVSCARAIAATVRDLGLPDRAVVIAVATAIVETTLQNNPNVLDHTSVGLFQQQDFWGTTEQRLNPAWSTTAFINAMLRTYPGGTWQSQQIGTVCQGVQQSAYPDRYQGEAGDAQVRPRCSTPPPTPSSSSVSVRTV